MESLPRSTGGAEIAGMETSNCALGRLFDRGGHRSDPAFWTVESENGVVATAHYLATAVGVGMLSMGGNAVDAAVAASLALGVCEPAGSGLGGMSLVLIHLAASNRTFTLAGIIRKARRDRQHYRLRTGAEEAGEAAELLSPQYARTAAQGMRYRIAEGGETSHVSVVDRQGNSVSMTQSIERSYRSGELCPELGFLYNGFLRAFKVENRRHSHYLRPGAPARSSASPTIALRGGCPWAVLGSTGSERATSGIFQTLVRLSAGKTPFDAVHGPRLHCTPEGEVLLEKERFIEVTTLWRLHLRAVLIS